MHDKTVEQHPFAPILPPHATAVMMGTMPPTADKWCMAFHYPNFYNDMWRIYGKVFFDNVDYFRIGDEKRFDANKIQAFLMQKGIGELPTVTCVIREKGNASDAHLTVIDRVDLASALVKLPKVKWLFTIGGKATDVLIDVINEHLSQNQQKPVKSPKTNQMLTLEIFGRNLTVYRLPSSSRAYPMSFDKKVEAYRRFFKLAELI
ncbi:G:T/U mismatch-specific DNA glycosylase-like protein [Moraxella macacae 0408225]|uniref:G:T/U mismatch-specific DNA glycosylase-like protein n=1 Tax=Moraxella macacae 0408225 TaxID=1230338 RepID=L2F8R9_9GAMM|nr:G:T/U mismatch-specific DNA glycosylase-like protein [Moraxella macacae 0408225]